MTMLCYWFSDTYSKRLRTYIRDAWNRENVHISPCCESLVD